MDIRPTSDRLRETLFNVLTGGNPEALAGSVWVDLFAGTGAVGIEALSRGADKVYFVESAREAVDLIRKNLASLDIMRGFELIQQSSARATQQLEGRKIKANFVFLDPPYNREQAYAEVLRALGNSFLARDARVIAEHQKRFDPGEDFGAMHRFRKLVQGDAALSFYSWRTE
jgi:16S rRNA (guanine966-N2)-methyltransferase